MKSLLIVQLDVRFEHDVVVARQKSRRLAELLGFESQDQIRVATAVSELARNAFQYAAGGKVEFALVDGTPQVLRISVRDKGPGIEQLAEIQAGTYVSPTGMGLGLVGARRLVDRLDIQTSIGKGTVVTLEKHLPRGSAYVGRTSLPAISAELAADEVGTPFEELRKQNRELLEALAEVERSRAELTELNSELEATNRGVVALYAELDEKAASLKRASEMKTSFLSNMTHEFRSPLNSILNISGFLQDRFDGPLTLEQEKQVQYIRQSAQALLELVNDLLDLSKVEAGKIGVRVEEFSLEAVFRALKGLMKPLIERNAEVTLAFDDAESMPLLSTDEGKLAQVLRNLISNAIKYTERGEVRVAGRVDGDDVVITVADTGIGIATEDRERIFEEFIQIESGLQRRYKGTGLGLSLVRRLTDLLGGAVSLTSELGVGSTFTIRIPRTYRGLAEEAYLLKPEVWTPLPGLRLCQGVAVSERKARLALVVDDDEASRSVLARLLVNEGFEVAQAVDGSEGLRRAAELRPDVITVDLEMPGMGGLEMIGRMLEHPEIRLIPMVVNTSHELEPEERLYLDGQGIPVVFKDKTTSERLRAALASISQREHRGHVYGRN